MSKEIPEKLDIRIVILQRGWIIVGCFSQEKSQCFIDNGFVIERWGTSEGLGELAIKGKLSETRLRKIPKSEFHELTIIMSMQCNNDVWKDLCG